MLTYLEFYEKIMKCETIAELLAITEELESAVSNKEFKNTLAPTVLNLALLIKTNTITIRDSMEDMNPEINVIFYGSEGMEEDFETQQLAEMKKEEINEVKEGNVFSIKDIKPKKKE